MSSWLRENVKYESDITRNDILDDMFRKLLNYLSSTDLIQTCDNESLRVYFVEYLYKYYYKNEYLCVNFDENYDWIDQLYSQDISEIFKEFLEIDNYYLTEIFKYQSSDKIIDFISQYFIYEEMIIESDEYDENNFYQTIDERRI